MKPKTTAAKITVDLSNAQELKDLAAWLQENPDMHLDAWSSEINDGDFAELVYELDE